MKQKKIIVQGLSISLDTINDADYISLTDIAKQSSEEPRFTIRNWMSNRSTLRYLGVWEEIHNPGFKRAEFRTFKEDLFDNPSFSMTPERWIAETAAIGLSTKRGRYGGGTYAHKDIAINFCYWLQQSFRSSLSRRSKSLWSGNITAVIWNGMFQKSRTTSTKCGLCWTPSQGRSLKTTDLKKKTKPCHRTRKK